MLVERNLDLYNLLDNKRVAIVGPSPHLIGCDTGALIDQYDVVCRVNDVIPQEYAADYGSKNDIIFHACPTLWIDNFADKLAKDLEVTKRIKYVICPKIKAIHDGSGCVVKNFNKINKYNIPFWWIGKNNYYHLKNQVSCEPNTGIMAIQILLGYDIKNLLITGFSFYHQFDTSKEYPRCYYNKEKYSPHVLVKNSSPLAGHNQSLQIRYFKDLVSRNRKIIKTDSFLNDLLSLEHNNILELQ